MKQVALKDKKYVLKNSFMLKFKGERYTNATLTDEIAEKIIAENEDNRKFFAKAPKVQEEAPAKTTKKTAKKDD